MQFLSSLAEQIKIRLQESITLSQFIPPDSFRSGLRKFHFANAGLETSFSSLVKMSLEVDENYKFLFPNVSDRSENQANLIILPENGAFNFGSPSQGTSTYSPPFFLVSQNFAKTTVIVDGKNLSCVAILDVSATGKRFKIVERFDHQFLATPNQILTFRLEDAFGHLIKCDSSSFFMIKLFQ